jgi:hypothetical protein
VGVEPGAKTRATPPVASAQRDGEGGVAVGDHQNAGEASDSHIFTHIHYPAAPFTDWALYSPMGRSIHRLVALLTDWSLYSSTSRSVHRVVALFTDW